VLDEAAPGLSAISITMPVVVTTIVSVTVRFVMGLVGTFVGAALK